jgi:DNA-directed RNA polymerase III subunit RPC6
MSANVEAIFLDLLAKRPQGVSQQAFEAAAQGAANLQDIADAINKLLSEGRLSLARDETGSLVYREVSPEVQAKFKGLGADEMLIYQLIEQSKDKGIWTRDLRYNSNLQQTQITKILKVLETRKLIKAVKSVQAKKKVYMLYNIEPSRDVTGGAWYNDQDFDVEFIQRLQQMCEKAIKEKSFLSTEEVAAFVQQTGVVKVDLKLEDIQAIINTLIYDGKVEEMRDPRNKRSMLYRPTHLAIPPNGFTQIPCAKCPVFNECSNEGDITPSKCVYYNAWLEM